MIYTKQSLSREPAKTKGNMGIAPIGGGSNIGKERRHNSSNSEVIDVFSIFSFDRLFIYIIALHNKSYMRTEYVF